MATETRAAHESDADRDATGGARSVVAAALRELTLLGTTAVWTVFWLNVVRLHLVADSTVRADLPNAAFVAVTTVLPAVALYLWHLGGDALAEAIDGPFDGSLIGDTTNT